MAYDGTLSEVSNRATWQDVIEVVDQDNGEPFDLSSATEIVVQVVSVLYDQYYRYGYGYGFGGYIGAPVLTATLSNGKVQHVQTGIFQFTFTRPEMNTLPGGDYNVGVAITSDEMTTEIFIGQVPVREGIITVQTGAI